MAFLPINLEEVQEQKPAPLGNYDLVITGAQVTETGEKSKNPGSPMLKFSIAFADLELNAPNITHYVTIPTEGDENFNFKALMLKRFLVAFSIPFSNEGIDLENLALASNGCTANLEVTLSEADPETGAVYNRIKLPRVADEPTERTTTRRRR